jgi:predicted aspartyl protease
VRIPIKFIDLKGNYTNDYVEGIPVVLVDIDVGFMPPSDPNAQFVPNFIQTHALVDTGANVTVISERITRGSLLRTVPAMNMLGQGYGGVYSALLNIIGDLRPLLLEVGTAKMRMDVVIGRDILSKLKLVIDTPVREFYLERRIASAENSQ